MGAELLAFCLRALSVGALLSPVIAGNMFIALPLPSLWVLASPAVYDTAAPLEDRELLDFAIASLKWCIGLSFAIHFIVGLIQTKRASVEIDTE